VAVHSKNPQIVLASQEEQGTLYRSGDGGRTWEPPPHLQLPVLPGESATVHGFKRIVFSPKFPGFVYAGACRRHNDLAGKKTSHGVYTSKDGGKTWHPPKDPKIQSQAVNDLAVHPDDPKLAYAATASGGLFKTLDAGASWLSLGGLAAKDVRSVAIRPDKPWIVWAGLHNGGVRVSSDGGKTWSPMAAGMEPSPPMAAGMEPNDPIWSLVGDPSTPGVVWAGSHRTGVHRWDPIEQQWHAVNQGLTMKAVKDLAISHDGRVLYAATTGGGVYRYERSPGR
jgi:photosystem II stability/assembly factor-like uncharacterized protein